MYFFLYKYRQYAEGATAASMLADFPCSQDKCALNCITCEARFPHFHVHGCACFYLHAVLQLVLSSCMQSHKSVKSIRNAKARVQEALQDMLKDGCKLQNL